MQPQRRGAVDAAPLLSPGSFLTRVQAAKALTDAGIPATRQSLDNLARVKKGPRFAVMLNRALYPRADLEAWIRRQMRAAK